MKIYRKFVRVLTLVLLVTLVFTTVTANATSKRLTRATTSANVEVEPLVPQNSVSSLLHFAKGLVPNTIQSNTNVQFQVNNREKDAKGNEHSLLQQTYKGIPVYGSYVQLNVTTQNKMYGVTETLDETENFKNIDSTAEISEADAIALVQKRHQSSNDVSNRLNKMKPSVKLMFYPVDDRLTLVYEIQGVYWTPNPSSWVTYVDANTGTIVDEYNKNQELDQATTGTGYGYNGDSHEIDITSRTDADTTNYVLIDSTQPSPIATYHIVNQQTGEGEIVSSPTTTFQDEGEANYYRTAVDAHVNVQRAYDFYTQFGRDGVKNDGTEISSYTGIPGYDNAYWTSDGSGNGALYFGDTGAYFDCLSCALDVVTHELTHGVTEVESGLEYRNQSGALNESFSDIMGALSDGNWTMGEDSGLIIRSLSDPSSQDACGYINYHFPCDQPSHMKDYANLSEFNDNGGVHTNSGIPNKAAYLMATKLDAYFPGKGSELLGKLTYNVIDNHLFSTAQFQDVADFYEQSPAEITGYTDTEVSLMKRVVVQAWYEVGITVPYTGDPSVTLPNDPPPSTPSVPIDDLQSTASDSTSVSLQWTAPSDATTVTVYLSDDGGTSWFEAPIANGDDVSDGTVVIDPLISLQTFQFKVTVEGGGAAGDSNIVTASTSTPVIAVSTQTVGSRKVPIMVGEYNQQDYTAKVESRDANGVWNALSTTVNMNDPTEVTGLTPNKNYRFRISFTSNSETVYSNEVGVKTKSEPIKDFKLKSNTASTVTITWTKVLGPTSMKLQQSTNGTTWTDVNIPVAVTSTQITVAKLAANTKYWYRLSVTGGPNEGISNVINVTTKPATPLQLQRANVTRVSATLSWNAPVAATAIRLEYAVGTSTTWTAVKGDINLKTLKVGLINLKPNTSYSFRLVVTDGENAGRSNTVTFKTLK